MKASRSTLRTLASSVKQEASSGAASPYSWVNPASAGSSRSQRGRLAGKRIAIKENISYNQAPTTCSSRILQDYVPPFTATCLQCLLEEGADVAGMSKMDEFGMGSTTSHLPPSYTPVHNPAGPHDAAPRSAGGSSGGSAAAVADGTAWAALGTDTGGSVRLPAAYCGVVGFKPSYGMISRHGVVAYADSLDTVGILSRDVETARQVYQTISRPDPNDMTSAPLHLRSLSASLLPPYLSSISRASLKGLRIGIPVQMTSTLLPGSPPPTSAACESGSADLPQLPPALLKHLQSLGATLHSVILPSLTRALPAYYVIASAEASSNLARYGGGWFGSSWESEEMETLASGTEQGSVNVGKGETGEERRRSIRTEGFGQEVKKRLLAGTYALSADEFNNTYLKALYLRSLLRADFARVLRIPDARSHAHSLASSSAPTATTVVDDGAIQVDVLLHPTAINTAPPLHPASASPTDPASSSNEPPRSLNMNMEKEYGQRGKSANEYVQDVLTVPASLAGLPAISVPAGKGQDGWPVGVSVVSQWGAEGVVLDVAGAVEDWARASA